MENAAIQVPVTIDKAFFRRFATFDTFFRQARWLTVGGFVLVMAVFAAVCFCTDRGLLGGVILAVGLVIPAGYLISFFDSVKKQAAASGLEGPRLVYTVTLTDRDKGIRVENPDGQQAEYPWNGNVSLYRVREGIYLYAMAGRAFLLPEEQIPGGGDAVWALAAGRLSPKQLHDRRGKGGIA